jgi:hypothetical protein
MPILTSLNDADLRFRDEVDFQVGRLVAHPARFPLVQTPLTPSPAFIRVATPSPGGLAFEGRVNPMT